nr:unnamed protein product [Digitaria exilis]
MSEPDDEPDTCYRWSCNFVVAHAVLATGFVTAPVAVLRLLTRPHSGAATFFAIFSIFCAAISLVLCCRFYSDLKRPPWPRWFSGGHQQQQDGDGGEESTSGMMSHDLRRPEMPVMVRLEMRAALATDAIPSYEHVGEDAEDCAVCLGEVEKGEMVRRLPVCQHVFHRECVDLWLRAHATCPVCRGGMLPERPPEVLVNIEGSMYGPQRHVFPRQSSGLGL